MSSIHTPREAKEFLISKIVEQAQQEQVSLSEIERKMLYYTESGWTLPDIADVSDDFDREYDQTDYEDKIAKLVRRAYKGLSRGPREEYEKWWTAIHLLEKEDHYILVMIGLARLRPRYDQLKLFSAGLAIATCLLVAMFLSIKYNVDFSRYMPSREAIAFYIWAVAGIGAMAVFLLSRFIFDRKKLDNSVTRAVAKLLRLR